MSPRLKAVSKMVDNELVGKLKTIDFQITPGALEIINSSKIPAKDLINELSDDWGEEKKIITVRNAINLVLTIKKSPRFVAASKEVISELKTQFEKEPDIPRLLRRTYFTLKKYNTPVTAGHISRVTHKKKNTEMIYLSKLINLGFVKKEQRKDNKIYYCLAG